MQGTEVQGKRADLLGILGRSNFLFFRGCVKIISVIRVELKSKAIYETKKGVNAVSLKLILMVGLPGSGKSTWVRNNTTSLTRVVHPDAIRREIFGVQFDARVEPAVWQIARAMTGGYLALGFSVILDATNLTARRRMPFIRIAQRYQAIAEAVVVATPVEECLRRNALRESGQRVPPEVIINKSRYIEWPSYGEGLENIMYVS